ncbi:glucose-6-phosphate isomerase [Pseudoalteromonas sp. BDTF-M6]|uniref:glucose-6-phosphate isomerase n=1 Tax=Pseudoalteromonas sp. BDTF-M6 TaxID=2796132 RepID=UPI001BB0120E|nr:glucose-6-phosphate isomerase [Pseudoalteromonas sp. BDTF-M6]MBS3798555.1 glucose-6-phosphate isomerase [Pseudoalteromonas sp. BDTF-M6]
MVASRSQLTSWLALKEQAKGLKNTHLKDLFAAEPSRFDTLSLTIPGVLFDYSKQLIDVQVRDTLVELAEQCDLPKWRDKMFAGDKINFTEQRAVLHTALRNPGNRAIKVDGVNVVEQVHNELAKMAAFVDKVRSGQWLGYSNKAIRDVVSIGVGGSNLGPQMATEALASYADETLGVHYISNVDGVQIAQVLKRLDPETTLFVVSSKTFTTSETMTNATTAVRWLKDAAKNDQAVAKHFVAVSTNLQKTAEFGIADENVFTMWDWVGGRFSMWSAIGLPIALYLGFEAFTELLAGAFEIDEHFCQAPLAANIPVLMGLLSVWNTSFLDHRAQAILPYDQALHMLPAYLQQGEMESNGKAVNFAGESVNYNTVPLIWGMTGINGQHAFYQYLHQGTTIVPADFIASVQPQTDVERHHDVLMSNFFAQSEAMMNGVDAEQVRADLLQKGVSEQQIETLIAHKIHQGNRPTSSLILDKVDARGLGRLIALYEHKIFVQGIVLEICSFDQWGVELGKGLAKNIESELRAHSVGEHDSSTQGLMAYYLNKRH